MARRRLPLLGALALGVVLVVSGCTQPSNAPTEFDDQVQSNYLSTCAGDFEGSGTSLASSESCQCQYTVVTGYYQDDFTGFQEMDNELRSNPEASLPDDLVDELSRCPGWAGGGEPSPSTTTTAPSAAPTAPTTDGTTP